jgi:threonylcarbamoyladenosine tRNA methylthiotransferase MtaB
MKRRAAFKTLGCRLNQFETDAVLTDFYKGGYEIVKFTDPADVYIINTCTVTHQGDHKSKTAINQAIHNTK